MTNLQAAAIAAAVFAATAAGCTVLTICAVTRERRRLHAYIGRLVVAAVRADIATAECRTDGAIFARFALRQVCTEAVAVIGREAVERLDDAG